MTEPAPSPEVPPERQQAMAFALQKCGVRCSASLVETARNLLACLYLEGWELVQYDLDDEPASSPADTLKTAVVTTQSTLMQLCGALIQHASWDDGPGGKPLISAASDARHALAISHRSLTES